MEAASHDPVHTVLKGGATGKPKVKKMSESKLRAKLGARPMLTPEEQITALRDQLKLARQRECDAVNRNIELDAINGGLLKVIEVLGRNLHFRDQPDIPF